MLVVVYSFACAARSSSSGITTGVCISASMRSQQQCYKRLYLLATVQSCSVVHHAICSVCRFIPLTAVDS
jgi:hypothetical protein